jgi:hypothetical protein
MLQGSIRRLSMVAVVRLPRIRAALQVLVLATLAGCSGNSKNAESGPPGLTWMGPADPSTAPRTVDGFTQFAPSADTIVYYVSSTGSDDNDGTSENTPLLTPAAAMSKLRDGAPDWILFRRGDKFSQLGQLRTSGRSATEPILFGSYGNSTERPRFTEGGFNTTGARGGPEYTSHVAFMGLEFNPEVRDPAHPQHDPTFGETISNWFRGSQGIWFEDCVFQWGMLGFSEGDNLQIENLTFRRCQILDAYNSEGAHAQGIYVEGASKVMYDECLFDHNGWHATVPSGNSTIFNHNIYMQNGTRDVTIRNSISMRASSHGLQFRGGGKVENSFFYRNPINVLIGGGTKPDEGGVVGEVKNNVILEGSDMNTGEPRGGGIDLENIQSAVVDGNIVSRCVGTGCKSMDWNVAGVQYGENVIYKWDGRAPESTGEFPNPEATLEDYAATLGMSLDEFYAALRKQSQFNWRPELTAPKINDFFRAAFGRPAL